MLQCWSIIMFKFDMRCQNINYSSSASAIRELKVCYLYFLIKVADLADTVSVHVKIEIIRDWKICAEYSYFFFAYRVTHIYFKIIVKKHLAEIERRYIFLLTKNQSWCYI